MTRIEMLKMFLDSLDLKMTYQRKIVKTLLLRRMNSMAYLKDLEPGLRDTVQHKDQLDVIGVVLTKYPSVRTGEEGKQMLDVRIEENLIVYGTPAANWSVIKLNDEVD